MDNKNHGILEGFLVGFFLGLGAAWLYEENKKNQKRIKELNQRLNQGLNLDSSIIQNDWQLIVQDFNSSYEELSKSS